MPIRRFYLTQQEITGLIISSLKRWLFLIGNSQQSEANVLDREVVHGLNAVDDEGLEVGCILARDFGFRVFGRIPESLSGGHISELNDDDPACFILAFKRDGVSAPNDEFAAILRDCVWRQGLVTFEFLTVGYCHSHNYIGCHGVSPLSECYVARMMAW
jgi:hypothetical protein